MKTHSVWKYPIGSDCEKTVRMPVGAQVLHVGLVNDCVCIWARVESTPTAEMEDRTFRVYGTGWVCPEDAPHLGTVVDSEQFVWHVFETTEQEQELA